MPQACAVMAPTGMGDRDRLDLSARGAGPFDVWALLVIALAPVRRRIHIDRAVSVVLTIAGAVIATAGFALFVIVLLVLCA